MSPTPATSPPAPSAAAGDGGIRSRVRAQLEAAAPGLPAEDVERAVYNAAIRRCHFNAAPCSWGNVAFGESYRSGALYAIRNAPALAECIGAGQAPADAVARSPQDLRPDLWGSLVRKKKERDAAYGAKPTANTNMYRCKRCQSRECHYFGLQTRSGDEPMTIFISCLNCGNRWRTEG